MASQPTPSNRFNKQGTGDNTGAWGFILDEDFELIDTALDGVSVLAVNGAITPAAANYIPDEVRARVLKFTGPGGSVQIPGVSKNYLVHNSCAAAVIVKTASAAGTSIAAGTVTSIYCDGVDCVQATNLWPLLDGTALEPAAYFVNDTNTGFYRAGSDRFGISAGGSEILDLSANGAVITGSATVSFGAILNDGSAAIPAVRFIGDTNTGIYRVGSDSLGVSVGGANKLQVDGTGIIVPGQVRAATTVLNGGSVAAPAFSVSGDSDTGIYWPAANTLSVAAGGVNKLQVDSTGIVVSGQARATTAVLDSGTAALPAYSFAGDSDTGIFWGGANTLSVAAGGVNQLQVDSTGLVVSGQVRTAATVLDAGSAAAPAYSFAGDSDTGIYSVGANDLGVVAGGSKILDVTSSGLSITGAVSATGAISASLSANSALVNSLTNSNAGAAADAYFQASNGGSGVRFGQRGSAQTTYGALVAGAAYVYTAVPQLTLMADSVGGKLSFAAGGNVETGRNTTNGGFTTWRFGLSSYAFSSTVAAVSIGYAGDGSQYGITMLPQVDTTTAIDFKNAFGTTIGSISQTASVVSYNTSSDYRLKDEIADLEGSGEFIDALKPRSFVWKASGTRAVGFIAHEVAEVSPSSVTGEKDAKYTDGQPLYQGMQPGSPEIIANLVAEIKALRARVAVLEAA